MDIPRPRGAVRVLFGQSTASRPPRNEEEEEVAFTEDYIDQIPQLGINLSGRESEDGT